MIDTLDAVRIIHEISQLIRDDSNNNEKYNHAVNLVREALACNAVTLFLNDFDDGVLKEAATSGIRIELIEGYDFGRGKGMSGWVAGQRRLVMIPRLSEKLHKEIRSFIASPLLSEDELLGVLNIGHKDEDAFSEDDRKFIEIITEQLALMLERSKFEAELAKRNTELQEAQDKLEKAHKEVVEMERFKVFVNMTASINHEINNPLTTVIGNIELLLMANPHFDDRVKNRLNIILEEARRIGDITNHLRDMKKKYIPKYLGENMPDGFTKKE